MSLVLLGESENVYIYPWYLADLVATRDVKKITGRTVSRLFAHIEQGRFRYYYDLESAHKIGRWLMRRITEDRRYYKKIISGIGRQEKSLLEFIGSVDRIENDSKSTDEKLAGILNDYSRRLRAMRAWGWLPVFLDGFEINFLSDHLRVIFQSFLRLRGCPEKFAEYYSLFSTSDKMSEVGKEHLARLKMLRAMLKSGLDKRRIIGVLGGRRFSGIDVRKANRLIAKHLHDFGWLTYYYSGPAMSRQQLKQNVVADFKAGDIDGQIREVYNKERGRSQKKKKLENKLGLNSDLKYFFTVSARLMQIKDQRKGVYQKSYLAMDKIMLEAAKRIGLSLKEAKYLTIDEITRVLKGAEKSKLFRAKAKSRAKKCCYEVKNGIISIKEGKKCSIAAGKAEKEAKAARQKTAILTGLIAYPGIAKGKVRIVNKSKDMVGFKRGNILVSRSTNPDLILAMRKAAAIVTDSGGIVSHAAIVSRELKIPCIVGARRATEFFRDGDRALVDAEKGRIFKI